MIKLHRPTVNVGPSHLWSTLARSLWGEASRKNPLTRALFASFTGTQVGRVVVWDGPVRDLHLRRGALSRSARVGPPGARPREEDPAHPEELHLQDRLPPNGSHVRRPLLRARVQKRVAAADGPADRWAIDPKRRPDVFEITTKLSESQVTALRDNPKIRDVGKLAAGSAVSPYAALDVAHAQCVYLCATVFLFFLASLWWVVRVCSTRSAHRPRLRAVELDVTFRWEFRCALPQFSSRSDICTLARLLRRRSDGRTNS